MIPVSRRALALALALLMVTSMAAPAAAATDSFETDDALTKFNGKTTPFTASLFDDGSLEFTPDEHVVTHGPEGLPGWYVSYDPSDADALENLNRWVNGSSKRSILWHDQEDGLVLLTAPADHIRREGSWFSVAGLSTKGWVEWFEVEQRFSIVDPVNLQSSDVFNTKQEPGRTAQWLAKWNGGEFTSQGLAYSGDVNRTNMADVKDALASASVQSDINGSGVTMAFLDTGANVGEGSNSGLVFGNGTQNSTIRIKHGKNFLTGATINTSTENFSAISDGNGHGTYVTARAAGAARGNTTIRSNAYAAELAIAKVMGDDGSGSVQNIVRALEWASSDKVSADVISMSLGSPHYSKVVADAVHEALEEGGVSAITVAAGNSRWKHRWVQSPGDVDGVITVTATTARGSPGKEQVAYFANVGEDDGYTDGSGGQTRGKRPDIAAPGLQNTVVLPTSSGTIGTRTLSGTSMATPDVAMAAALLLDAEPQLRGEHEQVRDRILKTASPAKQIGATETAHGMLNVSNMLADYRPPRTQAEVATEQARSRDKANLALSGDWAMRLKMMGVTF